MLPKEIKLNLKVEIKFKQTKNKHWGIYCPLIQNKNKAKFKNFNLKYDGIVK